MTEYRTVTDAKAHFNEIVESVQRMGEKVIVTRRGTPAALILSWDEWEGLLETVDILSTPGALDDVRRAHQEYLAGEFRTVAEVEEDLQSRGERRRGQPPA